MINRKSQSKISGEQMQSRKPAKLTLEITRILKEHITSGSFTAGDCLPSERELIKQFNVSRVTIRRSLHELVKEGLLISKVGSGYFLPSTINIAPVKSTKESVLFLHDKASGKDTNHSKLWHGAREFCIKNGFNIIIQTIDTKSKIEFDIKKLKSLASGIVSDFCDSEDIMKLHNAGIPIVQIYTPIENLPIDTIVQDDLNGVQIAYEHLIEKGHRRIAFLDKSASFYQLGIKSYNHLRRKLGYIFAAEQSGTYDPELIIRIGSKDEFLDSDSDCFEKIADSGATALIFPNGVNHEEIRKRLKIVAHSKSAHKNTVNAINRNNFGIVTWGEFYANSGHDATTYVDWSKEQMGQEGVRRLFERIREPNLAPVIIKIPTSLVEGNSSGKGPYFNKNLAN